jgi:hypothetical protein
MFDDIVGSHLTAELGTTSVVDRITYRQHDYVFVVWRLSGLTTNLIRYHE